MVDDYSLIQKIKEEKDNNSFNELVNRHTGIYNTTVYRYLHTNNSGDYHDFISNREYNFYSFINDFKPEKNVKFSTFVGDRTRYLCLSKNYSFDKVINEELNEEYFTEESPDSYLLDKDMHNLLLEEIENIKNKQFKEIMKLRFLSSNKILTWKEVAQKLGVSTQLVNRTYNDNIDNFKKKFLENFKDEKR